MVLDLMLPGLGGEAVLESIRDHGDIPVLIASAKRSDAERIAGLRMGADDYLAKPFNPNELTARVAAILRRTGRGADAAAGRRHRAAFSSPAGASRRSEPRVTPSVPRRARTGGVDGGPDASPGQRSPDPGGVGLLAALARRPGAILTREQLLDAVTRRPDEVYDRVVDVHVANLRRKLGDDRGAIRGSSRRSRRSATGWWRRGIPHDRGSRRPSLGLAPRLILGAIVLGVLLVTGLVVNRVVSSGFETVLASQQQQRLDDAAQPRRPPRSPGARPAVRGRLATNLGGEVRVLASDGTTLAAFGRQPDGGVPITPRRSRRAAQVLGTLEADLPSRWATAGSCRCST